MQFQLWHGNAPVLHVISVDKASIPFWSSSWLQLPQRGQTGHSGVTGATSSPQPSAPQVCEQGGIKLVIKCIDEHVDDVIIVAAACGLLRQLAKSDSVKVLLADSGGFDMLARILDTHRHSARVCTQVREKRTRAFAGLTRLQRAILRGAIQPALILCCVWHAFSTAMCSCSDACPQLQALGLLATLLLRHPDHCEAAFAHPGLMDLVADIINSHDSSAPVMRQACQVVRNLVVRNSNLRKPVIDMGIAPVVRSAKKLQDCNDVAVAALRDLGFDDYKA
jgi:hypothetical protein